MAVNNVQLKVIEKVVADGKELDYTINFKSFFAKTLSTVIQDILTQKEPKGLKYCESYEL
jgi:hypothetical protein